MKAHLVHALVNVINRFMLEQAGGYHERMPACSSRDLGLVNQAGLNQYLSHSLVERSCFQPRKAGARSIRIFSPEECTKITVAGRQFILQVEKLGVIDAVVREEILDAAMSIAVEHIDREQLKWILFAVLATRKSDQQAAKQYRAYASTGLG